MQIELKELVSLVSGKDEVKEPEKYHPSGTMIVVLDRGFVYAGTVEVKGDWLNIHDAKNIRRWGTTKGLGELVNGPLPSTEFDKYGEISVPLRAVIHTIKCKPQSW